MAKPKSYMTPKEYRALLEALGLNMTEASLFLRIDPSTHFRRMASQSPITFETAALLRLMATYAIEPRKVEYLMKKG